MIKLFAWEGKTIQHVTEKREEELAWFKKRQLFGLLNMNIKCDPAMEDHFHHPVDIRLDFTQLRAPDRYYACNIWNLRTHFSFVYSFAGTDLRTTQTVIMKQQLSASVIFSSIAVFDAIRDMLHICAQGQLGPY